ncbi:Uncharacterised protein [Vibrio cholerae]|nr:Uncharacterised protein [Vibrio cholerae]
MRFGRNIDLITPAHHLLKRLARRLLRLWLRIA